MDQTTIRTLYIFVEISIDSVHLAQTIRLNFPDDRQEFRNTLLDSEESDSQIPLGQQIGPSRNHLRIELRSSSEDAIEPRRQSSEPTKLALVSTIQFVAALSRLKDDLTTEYVPITTDESNQTRLWTGKYEATIPRSKPLSPGEILGCTAPTLKDVDALMYVFSKSGSLHLEIYFLLVILEMADFTWNRL
jgi:2-(3-amino-3-carboxypropyl)histidine synthase